MLAGRKIPWTLVALAGAALSAGCQRESSPSARAAHPGLHVTVTTLSGGQMNGEWLAGKFFDCESMLDLRQNGDYAYARTEDDGKIRVDGRWSPERSGIRLKPDNAGAKSWYLDVVHSNMLRSPDNQHTFERGKPCPDGAHPPKAAPR